MQNILASFQTISIRLSQFLFLLQHIPKHNVTERDKFFFIEIGLQQSPITHRVNSTYSSVDTVLIKFAPHAYLFNIRVVKEQEFFPKLFNAYPLSWLKHLQPKHLLLLQQQYLWHCQCVCTSFWITKVPIREH